VNIVLFNFTIKVAIFARFFLEKSKLDVPWIRIRIDKHTKLCYQTPCGSIDATKTTTTCMIRLYNTRELHEIAVQMVRYFRQSRASRNTKYGLIYQYFGVRSYTTYQFIMLIYLTYCIIVGILS
jgi:hypothetical protein